VEVLNITINNRRIKIVNKLINSNSFYIISDLANFFNVSSRTIRYDLDNIDEFLQANGISRLIRKPNTGVKFPGIQPDKNKLLKLIKDLDAYNYILSSDERVYYILNELIQQQDYITINYLTEKLMVSRNTIIKDLKEVKRWLTDYNLKIESATKHGIRVTGEKRQLRRAQIEIAGMDMKSSSC
jgi:transcriptional antiterminator